MTQGKLSKLIFIKCGRVFGVRQKFQGTDPFTCIPKMRPIVLRYLVSSVVPFGSNPRLICCFFNGALNNGRYALTAKPRQKI